MQVLKDNDLFQPTVCEALYTGGIRSMDTWLAKLVAFLREADLYDDVMIVITSDHGEEFADHSPRAFYDRHGHSLYEELIHVPLIIKLPGQQHAGLRVREVTRMVDVMPTILDVMEAASPKAEEMQGASLRGYWDPDLPQPQTSPAFSEALARRYEKKALRDLRYKYILSMSEEQVRTHGRSKLPETPEQVELYKLRSDPQERRNLIDPDREGGVSETAAAFDFLLREFASGEQGEVEPTNIDEDTLEMLRSLGYME
jgi:arylsulfatase A-like enzyme